MEDNRFQARGRTLAKEIQIASSPSVVLLQDFVRIRKNDTILDYDEAQLLSLLSSKTPDSVYETTTEVFDQRSVFRKELRRECAGCRMITCKTDDICE